MFTYTILAIRRAAVAVAVTTALFLCACTTVNVRAVPDVQSIKEIYIIENPKVAVDDFLEVLTSGFENHGIGVRVGSEENAPNHGYVVRYVAYRKWDLKPYMTDASIDVSKDGLHIAHADYHLINGGGLDLGKFAGTHSKIDPIIDQLLGSDPTKH
jgi:hypothetical protein